MSNPWSQSPVNTVPHPCRSAAYSSRGGGGKRQQAHGSSQASCWGTGAPRKQWWCWCWSCSISEPLLWGFSPWLSIRITWGALKNPCTRDQLHEELWGLGSRHQSSLKLPRHFWGTAKAGTPCPISSPKLLTLSPFLSCSGPSYFFLQNLCSEAVICLMIFIRYMGIWLTRSEQGRSLRICINLHPSVSEALKCFWLPW